MAILQGARITGSIIATTFIKANGFSGSITASRLYVQGSVGIGTTSPVGKLHIVQNNAIGRYSYFGSNSGLFIKANDNSINSLLILENTQPAANYGVSINFNLGYGGDQGTAGTAVLGSRIVAAAEQTWTSTDSTQDAYLAFHTTLNGSSSEKLRITSDGSVGIGTTSPSSAASFNKVVEAYDATSISYQVNSGGTYKAEFGVSSNGGWLGTSTTHAMRFVSNGTERMRITSGGNVIIGNTTAYAGLTISDITANDGNDTLAFFYRGTSGNHESLVKFYDFRGQLNASLGNSLQDDGSGTQKADLVFKTSFNANPTERMRITNTGNVGIGTTSPNTKLQVSGSVSIGGYNAVYTGTNVSSLNITATSYPTLAFYYGTTLAGIATANSLGLTLNAPASKYISFEPGDSEKMRITSAGNVGIGTSSPRVLLDLAKANNVGQVLLIGETSTNTRTGFGLDSSTAGMRIFCPNVASEAIYMGGISTSDGSTWTRNHSFGIAGKNSWLNEQGGNVGIGTSSPTQLLELKKTTGSAIALLNYNDSVKFNINASSAGVGYVGMVSNHDLLFVTNDTERARVTSTGCVGIGTTSVRLNSLLTVYGSGAFGTSAYGFYVGTDATGAFLDAGTQLIRLFAGQQERIRIQSDGNVGIGTTSPTGELHIYASQPAFRIQSSVSGNMQFGQWDTTYNRIQSSGRDFLLISTDATNLIFSTNTTERMRLTSGGNLGIGTTSINAKLDVLQSSTSNNQFKVYSDDSTAQLRTYSTSDGYGLIINQYYAVAGSPYLRSADFVASTGDVSSTMMRFFTKDYSSNPAERVRITSDGNVGIGDSAPSYKLDVSGSVRIYGSPSNGGLIFRGSSSTQGNIRPSVGNGTVLISDDSGGATRGMTVNNNGGITVSTANASQNIIEGQANGSQVMCLNYNGNIGLGTSSPAYKLEVASGTSGQQSLVNFRTADSTTANNAGIQIFATPSATATSREAVMALDADGANASGGDYFLIKKRGNSGTTDFEQYSNASMRFGTNFISRATYDMTIANDGNVGIGTTAPSTLLQLRQTTATHQIFSINRANSATPALFLGNDSSDNAIIASNNTALRFGKDYTGTFSEYVRIDTNGNVGIGTTSTSYKLEVAGTLKTTSTITNDGGIYYGGGSNLDINQYNNGYMRFLTNNNEKMRITSDGDVGISNSSPLSGVSAGLTLGAIGTVKCFNIGMFNTYGRIRERDQIDALAITTNISDGGTQDSSTRSSWKLRMGWGNGQDNFLISRSPVASNVFSDLFYIKSDGNVGIGTTSPANKLHISGSSTNLPLKLEGLTSNATGYFLTVDNTTGVVYKSTGGVNGTSGTSGANGSPGGTGSSGTNGTSGTSGANGNPGTSGTSGANGNAGSSGITGTSGSSGSSVGGSPVRAYVYFNGTGTVTINGSNNVTSITDNGVGDYTVNFTTAFVDAYYAVSGTCTLDFTNASSLYNVGLFVPRQANAQVAGSCRLACEYYDNTLYDCVAVRAMFVRA